MKKRIISFLLACFMVVSTFVISKPLIDVHAVENDPVTSWTLPMDWSTGLEKDENGWDIPVKGNWSLRTYGTTDMTNAEANAALGSNSFNNGASAVTTSNGSGASSGVLPRPYLCNNYNESFVKGANQSAYGSAGWYVCQNTRGSATIPFRAADNGTAISGTVSNKEHSAIVFTAPSKGIYSYKEVVEGLLFARPSDGREINTELSVRVNGEVIKTVTLSASNTSAELAGEVSLNKGDALMFAFAQTTNRSVTDATHKISEIVVNKLAEAIYELPMDWSDADKLEKDARGWSLPVQGAWALRTYGITNFTNAESNAALDGNVFNYTESSVDPADATTSTSSKSLPRPYLVNNYNESFVRRSAQSSYGSTGWYINQDTRGATIAFASADNGTAISGTVSNKEHSAIVFTAPANGVYSYKEVVEGLLFARPSDGKEINIALSVRVNGEVIKTVTLSASNPSAELAGELSLNKGDALMFAFAQTTNRSVTTYTHKIKEVVVKLIESHTCSNETLTHYPAVNPGCEDGNVEYWACTCGVNYSDANATSALIGDVVIPGVGHATPDAFESSATQHWKSCSNGCEAVVYAKEAHTWTNGACSICAYECKHEGANKANCISPSVCPECKLQLAGIDKNTHAVANGTYFHNGDGTHSYVRVCCDADSVEIEKCAYGNDGVCTKCGFDGSALIAAESNKNNAFDNVFTEGSNKEVNVTGPSSGALDSYKPQKNGTDVEGVEYACFNIHHENDDMRVTVRHHFIITAASYSITLNGEPVALNNVSGTDIYYFDVIPELGKYDVADEISVNGAVTYSVSLYSYIQKAMDSTELNDAQKDYLRALYDLNEEKNKREQILVGMLNQEADRIEVYDITNGVMDSTTLVKYIDNPAHNLSAFKFRSYEPYGDVVVLAGGIDAYMISYSTGETIWRTHVSSGNTHSIELLPNGIIVTGGTNPVNHPTMPGCTLTFFNINGENPSECILEIPFPDAHGVLWDDKYEVLWAVGEDKLVAYKVTLNDDGTVNAEVVEELCAVIPEMLAHDLQPYHGNDDCLIISTTHYIYLYDKTTKAFTVLVEEEHVKGVGNFENGDMIYVYWDGKADHSNGVDGWCTTKLTYVTRADGELKQYESDLGRFYKCRVWYTDYR